jgi:hypothetical protein
MAGLAWVTATVEWVMWRFGRVQEGVTVACGMVG